jgi:uncharacterized protein YbaR (Trm112 family)
MPLPAELMEILQCPACRGKVIDGGDVVECTQCGRRYPIRDGIPHMLPEEAEVPEGEKP